MKKIFAITVLMAIGAAAIAQEIIQQPSALNLYKLNNEGQEDAFFDHVVFEYDSMGRLINLNRSTNSPGINIFNKSYEYDSLGNLTYKRFYQFPWYTEHYYYSYDLQSRLVEYYKAKQGKYDYSLISRQVYEYSNDTLTEIYYYYGDMDNVSWILNSYKEYDYMDNGHTVIETSKSAQGLPWERNTYTYSSDNELEIMLRETVDSLQQFVNQYLVNYEYANGDLKTKSEKKWLDSQKIWADSTLTEYHYQHHFLVEKDFTRWAADTVNSKTREFKIYDENENCIQINYEMWVNDAFVATDRSIYVYDENDLCIAALCQSHVDSNWVKSLFSHSEPLFLNYGFANVNKELGTLQNWFRAEVTGYVSTANPYYKVTETSTVLCNTFPNPGNGIMKVSCNLDNASIRVFDIHGRWVKSQRVNNGVTSVVMDDVPTGLYIWQIWSDGTIKASGKWINY